MSDTLSAVSLLVRSLSDEVEARFEKSFAQRDAELLRLRADVIALKDEAALTLASAKKYFDKSKIYDEDYVSRRLKQFLDSDEFEDAVELIIDANLRTEFGGRAIAEINDLITERLKQFLDSDEFKDAVGQYFTDNWTGMQGVKDPDLTAKIRTTMCDILRHTAFVVPTS